MNSPEIEKINNVISSINPAFEAAFYLFLALSIFLVIKVKQRNSLSLKEAILFAVGLKKIKTTRFEKKLYIATIVIPLAIITISILHKA